MSAEMTAWAKAQNVANKNQRNVLILLAGMADPLGRVAAPVSLLVGLDGISTRQQAEKALTGLVGAALVARQWDPDKYVWVYQLRGQK